MGLVVDAIIIVVLLISTFLGYRKGLAKVLIKLLSFIISIIIAFVLYKPVSNIIIENTQIDETIQEKISVSVLTKNSNENQNIISKSIIETTSNTIDNASEILAVRIIQIGTMICLFVIAKFILLILVLISNIIDKIPIIKQFNKAGGSIYGFLKGSFIILIAFALISITGPLISTEMINIINSSIIGNFIYNNNILLKII